MPIDIRRLYLRYTCPPVRTIHWLTGAAVRPGAQRPKRGPLPVHAPCRSRCAGHRGRLLTRLESRASRGYTGIGCIVYAPTALGLASADVPSGAGSRGVTQARSLCALGARPSVWTSTTALGRPQVHRSSVDLDDPAPCRRVEATGEHLEPEGGGRAQAIQAQHHLADMPRGRRDRVQDLAGGGPVQDPVQPQQVPCSGEARPHPESRTHHPPRRHPRTVTDPPSRSRHGPCRPSPQPAPSFPSKGSQTGESAEPAFSPVARCHFVAS
jgi:hypothetical protein